MAEVIVVDLVVTVFAAIMLRLTNNATKRAFSLIIVDKLLVD